MVRRLFALAAAAALITSLVASATVSAASPPPFTVSPTTLSLEASLSGHDFELVTVTTGNRRLAIEGPASFTGGQPFDDTQAGTCWQAYGAIGLPVPARTSCTIQVGFHPTAAGTSNDVMTVYACKKSHVDPTSGFLLCDTRDGSRTVNLVGNALPDLIVAGISFTKPSDYPAYSYTVTVRNQGLGSALLTGVGVQGYYATGAGIWPTDNPACGTGFNSGTTLAPNVSVDIVVGCSGAPPAGDSFLVVKVDFSEVLIESDETNNVGSVALL